MVFYATLIKLTDLLKMIIFTRKLNFFLLKAKINHGNSEYVNLHLFLPTSKNCIVITTYYDNLNMNRINDVFR